jgi:hypothetical protein
MPVLGDLAEKRNPSGITLLKEVSQKYFWAGHYGYYDEILNDKGLPASCFLV